MSLLEISSRTFPLICCTCLTIRLLQIGKIRMRFSLTPLHTSGCLAVSPTSQNTVRNTAAMSAESVMPL